MAKRLLLTVTLLAVTAFLIGCGGGGSGNSSTAVGVNPNVPSIVQLLPVQYVAQTSSFITFKAKVLNGNGNVMPGVGVTFTKLSLLGQLSTTYAATDTLGYATVTVSSTTQGFTTLQAEVNTGSGMVRDKKTVLFVEGSLNLAPYLTLDVDGDNDGVWNEASDFILFEDSTDNQVLVRATVYSSFGTPVSGVTVTFGADTTSTDVTFPMGDTVTTDANGQAFVLVQVTPSILTQITTVLNITASANNGAFNLVSLYLRPVTIGSVTLYANPTQVDSAGTSEITAFVTTNAGTPAPDGTVVTFTASDGSVDPFAQTTDGITEPVTFTAPTTTTNLTVTITGTSGGRSGTATVNVVIPVTPPTPVALSVTPAVSIVSNAVCNVVTLSVVGGTAPYVANVTANTTAPALVPAFNDDGIGAGGVAGDCIQNGTETSIWNGATMAVTVPSSVGNTGAITITVTDAVAATDTATITVQP